MRKKKNTKNVEEKVLDVNASMQGTLRFDDPVNLRINGNFEGTLNTRGKLMVGEEANIKANLTGENLSIAGTIRGDIKAKNSLSVSETAHIIGNIETPVLSVENGAVINGDLNMTNPSKMGDNKERGDWMSLAQLAKYLEVKEDKVKEWVKNGVIQGTKENGEWVFERESVDAWLSENEVKG